MGGVGVALVGLRGFSGGWVICWLISWLTDSGVFGVGGVCFLVAFAGVWLWVYLRMPDRFGLVWCSFWFGVWLAIDFPGFPDVVLVVYCSGWFRCAGFWVCFMKFVGYVLLGFVRYGGWSGVCLRLTFRMWVW